MQRAAPAVFCQLDGRDGQEKKLNVDDADDDVVVGPREREDERVRNRSNRACVRGWNRGEAMEEGGGRAGEAMEARERDLSVPVCREGGWKRGGVKHESGVLLDCTV